VLYIFYESTIPFKTEIEANNVDGNCLFVSNQPFAGYQNSTVRELMTANFEVEYEFGQFLTKKQIYVEFRLV